MPNDGSSNTQPANENEAPLRYKQDPKPQTYRKRAILSIDSAQQRIKGAQADIKETIQEALLTPRTYSPAQKALRKSQKDIDAVDYLASEAANLHSQLMIFAPLTPSVRGMGAAQQAQELDTLAKELANSAKQTKKTFWRAAAHERRRRG